MQMVLFEKQKMYIQWMIAFISSYVFNFTKYISLYLLWILWYFTVFDYILYIVPTYKTKPTKVLSLPLSTSWIQLLLERPYSE